MPIKIKSLQDGYQQYSKKQITLIEDLQNENEILNNKLDDLYRVVKKDKNEK